MSQLSYHGVVIWNNRRSISPRCVLCVSAVVMVMARSCHCKGTERKRQSNFPIIMGYNSQSCAKAPATLRTLVPKWQEWTTARYKVRDTAQLSDFRPTTRECPYLGLLPRIQKPRATDRDAVLYTTEPTHLYMGACMSIPDSYQSHN